MRFCGSCHVLVTSVVRQDVVLHFTRIQKLQFAVRALMNGDVVLHVLVLPHTGAWRRICTPKATRICINVIEIAESDNVTQPAIILALRAAARRARRMIRRSSSVRPPQMP
jgi:hypothetical protein